MATDSEVKMAIRCVKVVREILLIPEKAVERVHSDSGKAVASTFMPCKVLPTITEKGHWSIYSGR